jgi:hypothetical protein
MDCSKRSVASRRFETDLSKAESLRDRGEYEDAAAQYSLRIRHLECEPSCDGTTARLIRALESYMAPVFTWQAASMKVGRLCARR